MGAIASRVVRPDALDTIIGSTIQELDEQLPDDEMPAALAWVRRHVVLAPRRPWHPAFFGAGGASRSDVAERSAEILYQGFRSSGVMPWGTGSIVTADPRRR